MGSERFRRLENSDHSNCPLSTEPEPCAEVGSSLAPGYEDDLAEYLRLTDLQFQCTSLQFSVICQNHGVLIARSNLEAVACTVPDQAEVFSAVEMILCKVPAGTA